MKVHNVRFGHATNSSSSHSIVLMDETPGTEGADWCDGEYGWANFTLADPESKRHYLGVQLLDSLKKALPNNVARLVVKDVIGANVDPENDYVDHDSMIGMPSEYGKDFPDLEFVEDFAKYLDREDVVILGGNDNSDGHPLSSQGYDPGIGINCRGPSGFGVCRKESPGVWTIFGPRSGTRITVDFNAPHSATTLTPPAPMLVDLKVTDHCPHGCAFCYQGSTPGGKHAEDWRSVIWRLSDMKVFEIAIGGGEPTLWPDFPNMVRTAREAGIVPNFSTRSIDWMRRPKFWTQIMEHVGAFAFSTQEVETVYRVAKTCECQGIDPSKVTIQYIMGLGWEPERFRHLLDCCYKARMGLTLLGFKEVGRGKGFSHEAKPDWLSIVKERGWKRPSIGIDTVLAKQYKAELEAEDVPRVLYRTSEDLSMYVDLVTRKVGPSSYCNPSEMVPLGTGALWKLADTFKTVRMMQAQK